MREVDWVKTKEAIGNLLLNVDVPLAERQKAVKLFLDEIEELRRDREYKK